MSWLIGQRFTVGLFVGGLILFGLAHLLGQSLWIEIGSRVLVYALAAASLDLLVGYAGMVSFGHAVFLLCGGYAVGILAKEGITYGLVQWPVAIAASSVLAAGIGALALRTGGIYFILLTLAFSQMVFYVFTGLSTYGGDEGLQVYPKSEFFRGVDLGNPDTMFLAVLVAVTLGFFVLQRVVSSPFGLVLQGCRQNEMRMRALGYETFYYKLVAFVIAGAVAGLAGALIANVTGFVTPDYGSWQRSGELLVMVILGGMGTLRGPLVGAVALLLLETVISEKTDHWPLILGSILVLVAIYLPNGLRTLATLWRRHEQRA
ncbi:MAG: branched-chain amino acid ABC transporter permease [Xanthobacteraceae bacterium]|nr:branched-chain amino acid ABC transporter permease [Xanthobacteraceae bacterium]